MKTNVLCILDGFAIGKDYEGNAITNAKKPNLDKLCKEYPSSVLKACGEAVGLPEGQMGNSEVGHLNIGAGRVVNQALQRINLSFKENTFKDLESVKSFSKNKTIHLIGLLSDGGVHSHINHLKGLLEMYKDKDVRIHIITDGRDVAPKSCLQFIKEIENYMTDKHSFATISGRYYAMDRDKRWDRLKRAYDPITSGKGSKIEDINEYIKEQYNKNIIDEFIEPVIIGDYQGIEENDGILFFNFRPDRVVQLCSIWTNKDYKSEEGLNTIDNEIITMTPYGETANAKVIFEPEKLVNGLGEVISNLNKKQLRIAETEKYPHVTYFFNGGEEKKYKGEDRILVASPKVATYDMKPEMSAIEVTDKLIPAIGEYDIIVLNYANCDMVGHTGDIKATITAVETVDKMVGKVYEKVKEVGGVLYITADHGNADVMLTDKGESVSKHSTNPVPFIVTKKDIKLSDGALCDIAPTILSVMDIKKPVEMTGRH